MDKQEYKIMSEEIMNLVANEEFVKAAEIADKIDWRRVKSFSTLQKISDLYKINKRFEEALELCQMAYERNPGSKSVVYSMCELYLELGDLVTALQYLAKFKKQAPNDTSVYILQYKVLEHENASLEDRIDLLEEFCRKDYREEWLYQLAYLYHRIGLATKCVETCDQLITWFGEGPFVIKSMELKMLHTPLSAKQQEIYDARNNIAEEIKAVESDEYTAEKPEPGAMPELGDEDFHVKTIDMSKFNTINLQKALADSMRELMGEEEQSREAITKQIVAPMMDTDPLLSTDTILANESDENFESEELEEYNGAEYTDEYADEYDDVEGEYAQGEYEGEDYPKEYAQGEYEGEDYPEEYAEENAEGKQAAAAEYEDAANKTVDEVFFDDKTGEIIIDQAPLGMMDDIMSLSEKNAIALAAATINAAVNKSVNTKSADAVRNADSMVAGSTGKINVDMNDPFGSSKPTGHTTSLDIDFPELKDTTQSIPVKAVMEVMEESSRKQEISKNMPKNMPKKKEFDKVLSQEQDGQISLVIPKDPTIEKQITGQMNLQDMIKDWENIKQQKDQEQKDSIKRNIMQRTGKIFENYDNNTKNSILKQLEEEEKAAKRVLKSDVEIHKTDDLRFEETKVPFDATAALNKSYDSSLWDEVNAAIAKDAAIDAGIEMPEPVAMAADSVPAAAEAVVMAADSVPAAEKPAAIAAEYAEDDCGELPEDYENAEYDEFENNESYEDYVEEAGYEEGYEEYADEAETGYEEGYEEYADEAEAGYEEGYEEYADEAEAGYEEGYEDAAEGEYEENSEESEGEYKEYNSSINTEQLSNIEDALAQSADKAVNDAADEINDNLEDSEAKEFSANEQELFANYLYSKKMKNQILEAVDRISLASYVGNVIITGDSSQEVVEFAKTMIKELQLIDSNFVSSKVAKISGFKMNRKNPQQIFAQLSNGALIIEKAGDMKKATLENITKALENTSEGIIIILTDKKAEIDRLIDGFNMLEGYFNARVDIVPMNDKALVEYAKRYAYSKEYKIDEEKAVLALHQCISELQVGEHNVTTREVEDIVDDAIEHSRRAKLSAFTNVLLHKRYDYEDMIILREKDFEYR